MPHHDETAKSNRKEFIMGDKGGKKDKQKSQKQKSIKHDQKEKKKHEKQQPAI
jgi:hypothetical protein